MPKKTHYAVCHLKYHLVWVPKYRKLLLLRSIEKRVKELFCEFIEERNFQILAMEVNPDHVHLFAPMAPKWAPEKTASIFKNIKPEILFEEFPKVKKKLWGGHLCSAGYHAASVGAK